MTYQPADGMMRGNVLIKGEAGSIMDSSLLAGAVSRKSWFVRGSSWLRLVAVAAGLAALVSCGGGGGNPGACLGSAAACDGKSSASGGSSGAGSDGSADALENVCTPVGEKQFIRAYLDEKYLWYKEIPSVDPAKYTVVDYFKALLVKTLDVNRQPKDRFSFIVPTADADSFSTGISYSYGVTWRGDRVAYVLPGSPAANAGMKRGGVRGKVISASVNSWYPNQPDATITFKYKDQPASAERQITLNAVQLTENPVPLSQVVSTPGGRKVGYVLFNDFSQGAQDKLIAAVRDLQGQLVQDLVLDLRYNGGGYLYIAQTLASMITSTANDGKIFEKLHYNDKRTAESAKSAHKFINAVLYDDGEAPQNPIGAVLPRLGLPRLYVLTSDWTCSASEAVINSLRGVDVNVLLVGGATCGKPYGFLRKDNCGHALYPIEFQGTNNKGWGDYTKGFAATCSASDDFDHELGNSAEGQLAAALGHIDGKGCSAPSGLAPREQPAFAASADPLLNPGPRHGGMRWLTAAP